MVAFRGYKAPQMANVSIATTVLVNAQHVNMYTVQHYT